MYDSTERTAPLHDAPGGSWAGILSHTVRTSFRKSSEGPLVNKFPCQIQLVAALPVVAGMCLGSLPACSRHRPALPAEESICSLVNDVSYCKSMYATSRMYSHFFLLQVHDPPSYNPEHQFESVVASSIHFRRTPDDICMLTRFPRPYTYPVTVQPCIRKTLTRTRGAQ